MDVNRKFFASTPLFLFVLIVGWLVWAALFFPAILLVVKLFLTGPTGLSSAIKPAGLLLASLIYGLLYLGSVIWLDDRCAENHPQLNQDLGDLT